MTDLLNLGTTALNALQQAINTTGHNISNVNTQGYSRQNVEFATLPPQFLGGSYFGSGTTIGTVERSYDNFLTAEVRNRTSSFSEYETLQELSGRLDSLLADPSIGLSSAIDSFFGAVQDVANNPGSLPERQVLLGQAQTLADRFAYLDSRLGGLDSELDARITTNVAEINNLSAGIAEYNEQIASALRKGQGEEPNDLMDTRDELIRELSSKIGITTLTQSDGAINVMVGSGQPLVVGASSVNLAAQTSQDGLSNLIVGRENRAGNTDDISRFISGGELGALLSFRESGVSSARNDIGLLAIGITESMNAQHQLGMDLNGQPGGNLFTPLSPIFTPAPANAGSGTLSVSITDVAGLTGDNYRVSFDAGQWTVTNLETQASQTGAGPFTVDGLEIGVSGAPANGDSFVVEPTFQGGSLFSLAISDPQSFAAASPLRAPGQLSNAGTSAISELTVSDASGLPLAGPVTLTFSPDALGVGVPGYAVTGIAGGPLAYDPATESSGKEFTLGGFSFSVAGTPEDGDALLIENNTNGTADNRNALALADLQTARTLFGGDSSYQEAYGATVSDLALQSQRAQTGLNSETVLLEQAMAARESVAGVNLDEEAANLIRYQQAYQAAAQIVSVADQLFQTLLNATSR
ncbi:MAG: flagellar hook-associated protein FlgK [Halioglobus sp.]